ncbi:MAG TPA: carboxypeptidase-like regulatory domain-containing protein [Acidobacteriaceae bacterium]|jgi:hypothetical protein|nr:carboxypeptidase-like regulatory domain-containing protein [Acidobacteriaceae bacterium]
MVESMQLRWWRVIPVVAIAAAGLAAGAQQTAKKGEPPTGTVTGSVACADTNAPARFALVTLQRVPAETGAASGKDKQDGGMNATATTDLDGRFEMDKVAVGRYYVLASQDGYLSPLAKFDPEQLHAMTEETRKDLAKAVPIVDVEAGESATVTLRLEHAAEVSGTVLYDDGSPAIGMRIQLMRKDKNGNLVEAQPELVPGLSVFGSHGFTDDRGRYELIGTPAGEYAVRASLPAIQVAVGGLLGSGGISVNASNTTGEELNIYLGDVFRKRDAKTVKVGEGEVVGGQDITVAIGGLHTVRGTVTAKRDGHALNSGEVALLYADDQEMARSVRVEDDGSFVLPYVPEGKYLLRATGGADSETVELHPSPQITMRQSKDVRRYGDVEMPLQVQGDMTGLELAAPEAAAAPAVVQQ